MADLRPSYIHFCYFDPQAIIADKEKDREVLRDVIAMLRNSSNSNPQIETITRTMIKWAKDKGIHV